MVLFLQLFYWLFQISDLQTGLRRSEQQANRREDNLRQEISDLQQVRLTESRLREEELKSATNSGNMH